MRRLSNMTRDEKIQEAREAWDLQHFRAAGALVDVSDDLLTKLLTASRKGSFDPTPFFDRSGRKWVAKIADLTEAFANSQKSQPKKKRSGWTAERRAKTMATRAAKKAAREKEISDLEAEIARLTLELVESEALVVKQAEEIKELTSVRTPTQTQGLVISPQQMSTLSAMFYEMGRMFSGENHSSSSDSSTDLHSMTDEENEIQAQGVAEDVLVPEAPTSPLSDEEDLAEMSVFQLNKKAAMMNLSADVNKDRLIEKIRRAMQS